MSSRTVEVPVPLPWQRESEPDVPALGRELRLLWLVDEVRQHRLGAGKAAESAGLPRAEFMRILGEHGVPVVDYPDEDLEGELHALNQG